MDEVRKIIHIDMDAFYASIEQRDNPTLRGKPIAVGGDPNKRGVVATCSYEARNYGIHSAMSSITAYKLCPHIIFVKPRMDVYKGVSNEIMEILFSYSDLVEPLAWDEAFIDVTVNKSNHTSATIIAKEIRSKIYKETGLTSSAGVSFNKFLAKVASDYNKPNGMKVIIPSEAEGFINNLAIEKIYGVGKVTRNKLHNMGIFNGRDLKQLSEGQLIDLFGKLGSILYNFARGLDERPVNPYRVRKSIGRETTLNEDLEDVEEIIEILTRLSLLVEKRMEVAKVKGTTITLKIKFNDFRNITRRVTVDKGINKNEDIMINIIELLKSIELEGKKVRLLGVSLSNFEEHEEVVDKEYSQIKFPII